MGRLKVSYQHLDEFCARYGLSNETEEFDLWRNAMGLRTTTKQQLRSRCGLQTVSGPARGVNTSTAKEV